MLRLLIIVKGLCVHTVVVVSCLQACFFLFLYLSSLGNIIRLGRVIKCATSILIVYLVRFNDSKKMCREMRIAPRSRFLSTVEARLKAAARSLTTSSLWGAGRL